MGYAARAPRARLERPRACARAKQAEVERQVRRRQHYVSLGVRCLVGGEDGGRREPGGRGGLALAEAANAQVSEPRGGRMCGSGRSADAAPLRRVLRLRLRRLCRRLRRRHRLRLRRHARLHRHVRRRHVRGAGRLLHVHGESREHEQLVEPRLVVDALALVHGLALTVRRAHLEPLQSGAPRAPAAAASSPTAARRHSRLATRGQELVVGRRPQVGGRQFLLLTRHVHAHAQQREAQVVDDRATQTADEGVCRRVRSRPTGVARGGALPQSTEKLLRVEAQPLVHALAAPKRLHIRSLAHDRLERHVLQDDLDGLGAQPAPRHPQLQSPDAPARQPHGQLESVEGILPQREVCQHHVARPHADAQLLARRRQIGDVRSQHVVEQREEQAGRHRAGRAGRILPTGCLWVGSVWWRAFCTLRAIPQKRKYPSRM